MNNEHPISDEVLELANMALTKGEYWMAYNQSLYFIDKDDVCFSIHKGRTTTLPMII